MTKWNEFYFSFFIFVGCLRIDENTTTLTFKSDLRLSEDSVAFFVESNSDSFLFLTTKSLEASGYEFATYRKFNSEMLYYFYNEEGILEVVKSSLNDSSCKWLLGRNEDHSYVWVRFSNSRDHVGSQQIYFTSDFKIINEKSYFVSLEKKEGQVVVHYSQPLNWKNITLSCYGPNDIAYYSKNFGLFPIVVDWKEFERTDFQYARLVLQRNDEAIIEVDFDLNEKDFINNLYNLSL